MSWIAVAIGGSALLGAGASYAGSKKQAKGAERAGDLNMEMFQQLNRQQQPYIQSGYGAMGRLNTLLGLNPNPRRPQMGPPLQAPGMSYQPMPGGGMQQRFGQFEDPSGMNRRIGIPERNMGGNVRLNQLLMMRAANGDRQAQAMLGGMG